MTPIMSGCGMADLMCRDCSYSAFKSSQNTRCHFAVQTFLNTGPSHRSQLFKLHKFMLPSIQHINTIPENGVFPLGNKRLNSTAHTVVYFRTVIINVQHQQTHCNLHSVTSTNISNSFSYPALWNTLNSQSGTGGDHYCYRNQHSWEWIFLRCHDSVGWVT